MPTRRSSNANSRAPLASAPRLPGRWLPPSVSHASDELLSRPRYRGQTHVRADHRHKVGHYRTDQIRPIATPNSVRLHRFFRVRISVSARHSIDHGTICGRSCAHSGHFKPLYARVNRTFCQIRRAGVSGIFFQGVGAAVRDSIAHGPHGQDDLVNAVAGCAAALHKNFYDPFMGFGDDDDPDGSRAWQTFRLWQHIRRYG